MTFRSVMQSVTTWTVAATTLFAGPAVPVALPRPDDKPANMAKPVKVFIMLGQSNMVGFGLISPESKKGTLEYFVKTAKKYPFLIDESGKWTVRGDVRCVFVMQGMAVVRNDWLQPGFGAKPGFIGPELGFGHVMGNKLDEPVLLIKACIGNRSLGWDYLPPGSERFEIVQKDRQGVEKTIVYAGYKDSPAYWEKGTEPKPVLDKQGKVSWYAGKQYDDDVADAKAVLADLGKYYPGATNHEIAGFCWFQGNKDLFDKVHASRYERNLVNLIKALRKDFNAPNAPFVLATGCGNPGTEGTGLQIAEAQLAVGDPKKHPEFAGNVICVDSRGFWPKPEESPSNQGYHYYWNAGFYMDVGLSLGQAMAELLDKRTPAIGLSNTSAAAASRGPAPTLTKAGEELCARYDTLLKALQAEIAKSVPVVNEQQRAEFMKLHAAEGVVEPPIDKNPAFAQAESNSLNAARPILADVEKFLAGDALDAKLVKCAVLAEATPQGLAEFAQQGKDEAALVERLLADDALMKQMLEAGGAKGGKYGRAMQIYSDIQKARHQAGKGILQRLALGTALEQAVSVIGVAEGGVSAIDPVKRYLNYEKAYLNGELDPAFPNMTAWECRFITNDPFTDEEIVWCREMIRNYYPDHIFEPDYGWRYVKIVRTDVSYATPQWGAVPGSKAAQLINGGGMCGPRAWFGRLAARSFGIPTWGVKQSGHAAMSHWTPGGWTVCFGAAWCWNWWDGRRGLDFLLETRARRDPQDYMKVLRAEWVADALGEKKVDGMKPGTGGFWNALALNQKRAIVAASKPGEVALVGQKLAEKFDPTKAEKLAKATITTEDKKIVVGQDGTITIPAAACAKPTNNTGEVLFMKSFLGGMQLHCNWLSPRKDGKPAEGFEYAVTVPAAGRYMLVARVVTVHKDNQHLLLTPNGAPEPIDMALPYTAGLWQKSEPVQITLAKGANVLHFTRPAPSKGLTIKEFTLTPVM